MLKRILIVFVLFSAQIVFGQTYAYSYEGNLTVEKQSQLIKECSELPQVASCKIRQKDEKNKGELIVEIEEMDRVDQDNPFSIAFLKSLLLSNGLNPISCIELKANK